jgi:hypothetical protein
VLTVATIGGSQTRCVGQAERADLVAGGGHPSSLAAHVGAAPELHAVVPDANPVDFHRAHL